MRNWLLPEFVEDVLPDEAWRVEVLRRRLLDHFVANGYELVMPPLIEYLESLLTGTGHDLDLRTFKLVDQLSGRTLGIRADITPQVARIDAHLLNRAGVTRLAYCGTVLHALPPATSRSREVLQIGAEVYGHSGVESDIEIQGLMLDALSIAGVRGAHLDLGHVGIFRSLCQTGQVAGDLESELFQALQCKDIPTLRTLSASLPSSLREAILRLPDLFGGPEVIDRAREVFRGDATIGACLDELERICTVLTPRVDALLVDLAELRGYHYHSGVVFAAYASGSPNAIAQGGRYDLVGGAFGRARPATGFSLDLRSLTELAGPSQKRAIVRAPALDDPALALTIAQLRAQGEAVVVDLPGERELLEEPVARELVLEQGEWRVVSRG